MFYAEIYDIGCHAVLISHNHYDHLDLSTTQAILKKFPKVKYFVPLGNKSWLESLKIPKEQIIELDWWESRSYNPEDFGLSSSEDSKDQETSIRFTCVPAQHNSARGALDQGQTLWCGWVVEQLLTTTSKSSSDKSSNLTTTTHSRRHGAIYHAGDTGYRRIAHSPITCPAFLQIGQKHGPFDLSFLPIWRGGSLGFISNFGLRLSHRDIPSALHASPSDAMDIHCDVRSMNSVGVHFGTFIGSENESLEAILDFEEARVERGVGKLREDKRGGEDGDEGKGRAGVVDIGGSVVVKISGK